MLAFLIFFILFCILLLSILLMRPRGPNPAILHVSIPTGEDRTVISDPDPWLNECWFLNITGTSGTFTVKIEDVSGYISSYDTRLVIALNDAAYNNLVSLTVDNVTIVKNGFKYGTLRPYDLWNWPNGDVYPTWFNDTLVNVGTIPPKGHRNVTFSVKFSNAKGARMHFDAYGSKKSSPIPPTKKCYVTHNPLSEDSTVLFSAPSLISPVACFTVSNERPNVCEAVTFNATCSYDPDGWIVNYTWNFGDSNVTTVTYPIITHHYDTFGNYNVTLTVTDNDRIANSKSRAVWVREHPVARFTYSPFYPKVCEEVVFDASDSTPDGGHIVNYTWNFGDSNITTVTDSVITHRYANHGNYAATLNVTDSEGKWDTESKMINVAAKPHADFTWSPPSPQQGEEVTLDASPSTPDGGSIVSYEWDFGDTSPHKFGKIVIHKYTTYGTYTVTLNVTDSEGRWDIETKTMTVRAHPNADFVWSPLQPEEDQTATFDASASTPNGGTIVSYTWNFGDGKSSTGKIVTHAYTTAGSYTVTLNVTDSEGKWDTESKQLTVSPPSPPPKPVGGHAVPIDNSHLLASPTNFALGIPLVFTLLVGTVAIIILIISRKKLCGHFRSD